MLRAIDEQQTIVITVHDSFVCVEEFKGHLRQLMAEEYIEVMRPESAPRIDMKPSDYYLSDLEKAYQAEYGTPYGFDISEDPKQKRHREYMELQASAARRKFGITIEDVFTVESLEQKHTPQEADNVM
jgi:hypothetical protein|tara:strand:- start:90 stop:473 length:384 start_codon:yes stop_codon:yes gene_type:complete